MTRLDAGPDHELLVRVLRHPHQLHSLSPQALSRTIDAAESARLLGWLVNHVSHTAMPAGTPPWLRDRLISAEAFVAEYDRAVRWEIDRLDRAFSGAHLRWVLMKGAAYLAAELPPGRGRRVADIDILVSESDLARAEELLRTHGWEFPLRDAYDERYYREWMHELPPMVHRDRRSVVDLHHAILPRTSRLHPPTERLLERSVEVAPGIRVLCRSHMVLHAAAHLFHDGEIAGAIRDLVDLDSLLRYSGAEPDFWSDLRQEAATLQLTRPAYYALRYAHHILNTPIPAEVAIATADWGPATSVRAVMDHLVERTLQGRGTRGADATAFLLYIRSHWLRMPPLLLVRHLLRKATRSH